MKISERADNWETFKKQFCKSCINKVYCLINNDGENYKAVPKHKGKGKYICEHYKARYFLKELT
jgi:hypothetical protein